MEWWWFATALVVVVAIGLGLSGRYLYLRRRLWKSILEDSIPANARWWRDYRERTGELLYVALGDSAAQGIGGSNPGRGYVGQLVRHIRLTTGMTVRTINLGESGSTIGLAVANQLPKLATHDPDLVTVAIGANDMADFHPEQFERDVRRLFSALPPHAIVADLPTFHFLPLERNVVVANEIVHRVAAEFALAVAPLHQRTRRQGLWGVVTHFAGDLFHPNDRGYRVWASAFIPGVDAVLRRRGGAPPA
ncbi:SGNH/GDSL hydrolase family protein [Galbitalea soli]|uniref:SGNH/GDSL hydrolase family protein n=1 Tax=Galbitalea soli TaxID=1268042 RepID=A0A7C9PNZ9_9MICO|nr:SGNH/GDSL hydrolase family protein [Galbitalea soli]NEM92012.1 SGNH/GDSL hydrolase family protein [Galbitalea soli]NYJ32036.1 lysophospholipase L1-like esterase [Galbitalea soli]